MTAVIYEAAGTVAALALPVQRARVIETPAVYQDQIIPAVTEERDGETVEIEPERTESVLVSDAVYRDETTEEMVARLIAAGHMPDLPWTRHVLVADTPPGTHGTHWTFDWQAGTVVDLPPPPLPPPDEISDRQFFQGLALNGMCTEAEAIAAVATGTIPAAMAAFIDALPVEQRFGARMILCGATVFSLKHPLTQAFAAMQGMSQAQLEDFWRFCASL